MCCGCVGIFTGAELLPDVEDCRGDRVVEITVSKCVVFDCGNELVGF